MSEYPTSTIAWPPSRRSGLWRTYMGARPKNSPLRLFIGRSETKQHGIPRKGGSIGHGTQRALSSGSQPRICAVSSVQATRYSAFAIAVDRPSAWPLDRSAALTSSTS